ncbi:uncharacterized protein L199_003391 [Kwoniella botswanensis]|uniref:uncharacterized protein n=1 Tax=Kwoniella botswanensis TaxID=1268659 RepID=UPI00315D6189
MQLSTPPNDPQMTLIANASKLQRFTSLLNSISLEKDRIIEEAQRIRPGRACILQLPPDSQSMFDAKNMYNGINVHFPIIFDDGVKWLLRVRQSHNGYPPPEIQRFVVRSEVTALTILKNGGVLVPDAWYPLFDGQSSQPDLCYFFCQLLNGASLNIPKRGIDALWTPGPKIKHIIEEYVRIYILMADIPISSSLIGCPIPDPDDPHHITIGPLATHRALNMIEPPYFPGPFKNNQERYLAQINIALDHIFNGHLCQRNTLDAYLWHLELRELVGLCDMLAEEPNKVYIRHADDKGDHLMGDGEGNVTGIIDWEWAYATTKEEAFSSPNFCFTHNRYYAGNNFITPAEELLIQAYERFGRKDLADCIRNGKIYQRLSHIGTFESWPCPQRGFLEVFARWKPANLKPPAKFDTSWRIYLIDRYRDNETLQVLIKCENWDQEKGRAEVESEREKRLEKRNKKCKEHSSVESS